MSAIKSVKGMNDILPADMPRWHMIERAFRETAALYGFEELRTPIVELTPLFVRSIGDATDIVEKEMYTFVDKGKKTLTMRPEGTASVVRSYIEHSLVSAAPVTRVYYMGPMFRRERPARGRYRQFYQLGAEVLGDAGPYSDAELIDLVVRFVSQVGVEDVEVLVNSLGGPECRARYLESLSAYLTPKKSELSEESQRRLETNPLRVLDSKSEQDQEATQDAPTILEFLSDDDQAHWDELKATLDAFGTPYTVSPRLVRGLDYYSRTLFEVRGRGELGAQNAICGGGRYDGLVRSLGGPKTPAIGFAMGLERLLLAASQEVEAPRPDASVIAVGDDITREGALLARELRLAGIHVEFDGRGTSLRAQLRRANKARSRFALVVGTEELAGSVVQVRDMEGQSTENVARADIANFMTERVK